MTLAIHHALRTSERATRTSERVTQFIGRIQTAPRLYTFSIPPKGAA